MKGEETADPRYAHWVLDPNEDSQVLIPPSPEVVETEKEEEEEEEEKEEEEEGQEEEENPARPATDSAEEGKQEKKEEQPELNYIWTCCSDSDSHRSRQVFSCWLDSQKTCFLECGGWMATSFFLSVVAGKP